MSTHTEKERSVEERGSKGVIRAAVVGASGFAGQELIRLLVILIRPSESVYTNFHVNTAFLY